MTKHTLARFGRAVSSRPPHSGGTAVSRKPLCRSLRRGVTLVELMISMLILAIVCIAWLQIIGIQSARKEARRREAVERLAGMMDAFMEINMANTDLNNAYKISIENGGHKIVCINAEKDYVNQVFYEDKDISPIGYRLYVVSTLELGVGNKFGVNWGTSCKWLVGELYEFSNCSTSDAGKLFFTLPVCLGM